MLHGVLLQFQLDGLSFQNCIAIVCVLVCKPRLEVLVFAIEKFQDFADYVGRVGVKELRILVEIESDIFLQANLEGRGF